MAIKVYLIVGLHFSRPSELIHLVTSTEIELPAPCLQPKPTTGREGLVVVIRDRFGVSLRKSFRVSGRSEVSPHSMAINPKQALFALVNQER